MLGYREYNCACIEQAVFVASRDMKYQIKTVSQKYLERKKIMNQYICYCLRSLSSLLAGKNETGVIQNIHVTSDLLKTHPTLHHLLH